MRAYIYLAAGSAAIMVAAMLAFGVVGWMCRLPPYSADSITSLRMSRIQEVVSTIVEAHPRMRGADLAAILKVAESESMYAPDFLESLHVDGWNQPFVLLYAKRTPHNRERWLLISTGSADEAQLGNVVRRSVFVLEWE